MSTPPRCRALYRDMVLVRRFDREGNALQRQGQLSIWVPLLGQEAAQIGAGRAMRPARHGLPVLPRARRRLVPRDRPDPAARHLPRHRPVRLGPEGAPGSTSTRSSSATRCCNATGYAMGQRFDGHGRRRATGTRRGQRSCFFGDGATSQGDVHEGMVFAAAVSTRRWCSTARTTSGRSPNRSSGRPGCRCTAAPSGYGFPGRPGGRQRRAGLPGRDPLGAGGVPHRQRPGADRGLHLPDGRTHHLR